MRLLSASLVLLATAALAAAEELQIPITVSEPAGIARTAEPACGGVPFLPGTVRDVAELTLVDGQGKPVPAQFSPLASYEGGSVQWALLDLLADVPASGKAAYVVRLGKAAAPASPLKIAESDDAITVETGAATFVVSRSAYRLLDAVSVGGVKVAGPGAAEIVASDGRAFAAAAPQKVSWEYRGPVRATLRLDGQYTDVQGKPFISYTTRLTFQAGSAAVCVDHSLRNSPVTGGFDALIRTASLSLQLDLPGESKGTGTNWAAVGNDRLGLLVSERHTAGCFPGDRLHGLHVTGKQAEVLVVPPAPANTKGLVGYADGHFALADLAHKDSQVWLDFGAAGRGAEANAARVRALQGRLVALADGAWISRTGTLTCGHFGTLDDEVATYRKWGWSGWDDQKKLANARMPHRPDAYVSKVDIHDESESDSVELFCLMFARTGERGFLDMAEAYGDYYRGHAVWRTDGFEYDGFRHERSGPSGKSTRTSTALRHGWYSPKEYGWSDSRFHMCHQWATGLLDLYCLTGNMDALEAGLDWAEYAAATYPDMKPGKPFSWGRAWGRSFGIIVRAWQLTRQEKWKSLADLYAHTAMQAANREGSGLLGDDHSSMVPYFVRDNLEPRPGREAPMPARLKAYIEQKGLTWKVDRGMLTFTDKTGDSWPMLSTAQSFEYAACAEPVARYAELTGDKDAAKLVLDMARCARQFYWSDKCRHAIPHPYIGFPDKAKVFDRALWDDEHANCPADPGGKHSGYHTRFLADIFARGYSVSGDPQWLELAKTAWSRGSKRGYWTTAQAFPENEVAVFAGHSAPKGDAVDIRNCMRLFYEVPRAK